VTTVAGDGRLGREPLAPAWQPAASASLRSPWDVAAARDGVLVIALAGSHQIGALDLGRGAIRALAGNGMEARVDGAADRASFAQPSGLAVADGQLCVADSESSSVRALDLSTGRVRTLVGEDLFVFGDRDGPGKAARLQHPLGIAL